VKTEREVGSGDQVLDHAGDEHLAGVGEGRDTNGDINGQAAEITGDGGCGGANVLPVPLVPGCHHVRDSGVPEKTPSRSDPNPAERP
jgi:hypothetical protein